MRQIYRFAAFFVGMALAWTCSTKAQTNSLQCLANSYLGSYELERFRSQTDLVIQGTTAFVASTYSATASIGELQLVDLSDLELPILLGSYQHDDLFQQLAVKASTVYAIDYDALYVIDISDMRNPVLAGSIELVGVPSDILLNDTLLYVSTGYGLETVDVSDPSSPALIATTSTRHGARTASIIDNYLYVTGLLDLDVFDLADPSTPTFVSQLEKTHPRSFFEVAPGYALAWLNTGAPFLSLLDVGNPSAPFVHHLTSIKASFEYTLTGSTLHTLVGPGLISTDVSKPLSPVTTSEFYYPELGTFFDVVGEIAVVTGAGSLQFVDLAQPRNTPVLASFEEDRRINRFLFRSVDIQGDRAYVNHGINRGAEFITLDISSPGTPVILGVDPSFHAENFQVVGDHVHVAGYNDGFQIYNISDPSALIPVSEISYSGYRVYDLQVVGNYVFSVGRSPSFRIYDVSDISNPKAVHEQTFSSSTAYCVAVGGNYAYIGLYSGEIIILDISIPSSPVQTASFKVEGTSSGDLYQIMVVDDHLFVPLLSLGTACVDISDPANPFVISVMSDARATRLTHEDGYLYGYNGNQLSVVDIADPANPILMGRFNSADYDGSSGVFDIRVRDGIAYLAAGKGGLFVVDVSGPCEMPCLADTNHDGSLTPADFTAWIAAFNAMAPECDQNGDGSCTPADFTSWVVNFNTGCP